MTYNSSIRSCNNSTHLWLLFFPFIFSLFFLINVTPGFSRNAYESFADLVEEISPAVVNITTTTEIENSGNLLPQIPKGSPLEDLFRNLPNQNGSNGMPRKRRTSALGSGFIISESGLVVTNNHVIEQADEILIELFVIKKIRILIFQ